MSRTIVSTLAICLILFTAQGWAQKAEKCKNCKGSGWVKCPQKDHPKQKDCGVKCEHLCSAGAAARCCYGKRMIPCPVCRDQKASAEFKALRLKSQKWRKRCRDVDLKLGARFGHAETADVLVHCSFPKWRFDKRGSLERNKAAHEFAVRLQAVADDFFKVMGRRPGNPIEVFVCTDLREMLAAGKNYAPSYGETQFPFRAPTSTHARIFTFPAYEDLYVDKGLHSHLLHNAAHALLQGANKRPNTRMPSWLDVGIAHWFEQKKFKGAKGCKNFCMEGSFENIKWGEPKKWAKKVAKEIASDKAISFAKFSKKEATKYNHKEHALAWSVVAFLLKKHPQEFREFFRIWCEKQNLRSAFKNGLKMTEEELDAKWKKFARKGKY